MLENGLLSYGERADGALFERPDGMWQFQQGGVVGIGRPGDPEAAFVAAMGSFSGSQEFRRRYEYLDSSTLPWLEGYIEVPRVKYMRTEITSRVVSAINTNPILSEIELGLGDDYKELAEGLLAKGIVDGLDLTEHRDVLRNMDISLPPIYKIEKPINGEDSLSVFFTRKDGRIEESPFVHVASARGEDSALVLEELSRFGYGIHMIDNSDLLEMPDLSGILEAMHNERGTLLQPSLESLQRSFAKREAVVLMDGSTPIGYVRFSELLNQDSRDALDLPVDFPLIYETGSAIILPEYRGRHLYPRLRTRLLSLVADRIKNKELLVLGTTKSPKVVESLDDSDELGVGFEIVNHKATSLVSAFTCVCEGDFGTGFQEGENCSKRANNSEIILIQNHDWRALQEIGGKLNGKIPCTLYVSDLELMHDMERRLVDQFETQESLVNKLRGVGHYE